MLLHRAVVGILAVGLGLFSTAPALAASQQVQVADNAFMPSAVAVKPGESVTWTNPGPAAGTADLHNVSFEDGMFRGPDRPLRGPWGPETRTFNTEGEYRYFCQEHGGPGGSGMSGIVFVNATGTFPAAQPLASFTVSPNPAVVGQSVSFNAAGSSDPDGTIAKYEWDLDGNGSFETDSSTTPMTSRSYTQSGPVNVKLRITDNRGVTGETTRPLTVNAPPVSSFTASPPTAQTGQMVAFDGGASTDSDGTIVKYEWDLDGDGSFETNTGATPTTSRSYTAPGTLSVKLRVTDDDGLAGETTRSLQIDAPPVAPQPQPGGQPQPRPTPTPTPPVRTPPPVTCNSLTGAKRTACIQKKTCSKLKRSKRAACIRKSCRYLKRSKRAACKLKSCRTLRGAKRRACARKYAVRKR